MRLLFTIAAIFGVMAPAVATAQTYDPLGPVLNQRCQTQACFEASSDIFAGRYTPAVRQASAAAFNACYVDNQNIGSEISTASFFITKNEQSRGGALSFDRASKIRALFYSETYFIRETLRSISNDGDVSQCHALKERANTIIQTILKENPVNQK